ncbi:hypothetical protein ACFYVR_21805 [Rhodococcus sp. NPDC003318]|uniref:hypothetical protein n=1 Tax=Rhodococcus sp. NPDC003318 TaxID=3364503 RepID=UPI0036A40913
MSEHERAWQAEWAVERERRLEALDLLPGKYHHERFEALNRTSRLFGTNGAELSNHISQFVGRHRHVNDLTDEFGHETVRLFHNYIASVATLRDSQRTTHRKIWSERIPESDRSSKDDKRTTWELSVYEPKVKEMFGDDDIKFLFDLRNCTLHHTVPVMAIGTTLSHRPPEPPRWTNTVQLKRAELEKFSGWGGPAKRFLRTHSKDVEFLPLLEKYSTRARAFYGWFWDQVKTAVRDDVDEYLGKWAEYRLWLNEVMVEPDWGIVDGVSEPIPGSMRRNRAGAHLERCAFGTAGWRMITVDPECSAIIGESNWDALPAVGKYLRRPSPAPEPPATSTPTGPA